MVDKLKDYSTTPASNNSAAPDGWPEGMAPSDVNNCAREMMARLREWYEDAQWINLGHVPSAYTSTTITVSGDVTGTYVAGRKIRLDENDSRVAKVESSSYSAPNTTVTVSGYSIGALPTSVEAHIISTDDYLPIIPPTVPEGYLSGCDISNNNSDSNHDIDISAGIAKDSTGVYTFDVSAITKRIDASWSSGTGNGGFPSALTLSANTAYAVFLIGKTDGTVDAGFDTDTSATNLLSDATGYTLYRRIGWVRTDASSNIRAFRQRGDFVYYDAPFEAATWTLSSSAANLVVGAPPESTALLSFEFRAGIGNTVYHIVRHPSASNTAPSSSSFTFTASANSDSNRQSFYVECPTDSSSQVEIRSSSTGGDAFGVMTLGWIDRRAV